MKRIIVLFATTALFTSLAHGQGAWVASGSIKIRPNDPAGSAHAVTLEAARNELQAVHVAAAGFTADLPVTLAVHGFVLPSTSSLRSAFGMGWADACAAHFGGYQMCGGDDGTTKMMLLYTRFALDHRITIDESVYTG